MKWLWSLWETIASWFSEYVWRFKVGKAGSGLVVLYVILDFHSRVETFIEEVRALPTLLGLIRAPWFDPILLIAGLCLIFWSSRKAKTVPVAKAITTEERVEALEGCCNWVAEALSSVPKIAIRLGEYEQLMQEATESLDRLRDIGDQYPGSAVSLKPFSPDWRPARGTNPTNPINEAIRDGEAWIRLLAHHWRHLKSWGTSRGENISGDLLTELNAINTRPDMSWSEAENLLYGHVMRVTALRDEYAAVIRDKVLLAIMPKSSNSPTHDP